MYVRGVLEEIFVRTSWCGYPVPELSCHGLPDFVLDFPWLETWGGAAAGCCLGASSLEELWFSWDKGHVWRGDSGEGQDWAWVVAVEVDSESKYVKLRSLSGIC